MLKRIKINYEYDLEEIIGGDKYFTVDDLFSEEKEEQETVNDVVSFSEFQMRGLPVFNVIY